MISKFLWTHPVKMWSVNPFEHHLWRRHSHVWTDSLLLLVSRLKSVILKDSQLRRWRWSTCACVSRVICHLFAVLKIMVVLNGLTFSNFCTSCTIFYTHYFIIHLTVADSGFPRPGRQPLRVGASTYYLPNFFCQQLHEMKEADTFLATPLLDPPMLNYLRIAGRWSKTNIE